MATFRDLAHSAKQRLKSGYWQDMYDKRDEAIARAIEGGESASMVSINMRRELKSSLSLDRLPYEDEERLREIIEQMLMDVDVVINPIGRLIDESRFADMTTVEKERYVLYLSKAYLDLRQKISSGQKLLKP